MYFRLSSILPIAAVAAVAIAAPDALEARDGSSQCNVGSLQCCNQTYTTNDPVLSALLGTLGVSLPVGVTGLVGLDCSPISVIGVGGTSGCSANPVCCNGVTDNGLINLNCNSVTL